MVDIAKCSRSDCPKCENCFRFKAKSSEWQSYIIVENIDNCNHYWQITNEQELYNLEKKWRD